MNSLTWLAVFSIVWGGALCGSALLLQTNSDLSGRMRQWIWRGAMALLLAPWIAAPVVSMLGLGLGAASVAPVAATVEPTPEMADAVWSSAPIVAGDLAPVRDHGGWTLPSLSLMETLLLIVAFGWAVRLVLAQLSARMLRRIVANSAIAGDGPARLALAEWSARLKLKRQPELRLARKAVSPFSFGVFRPVIVLPEGLEQQLDAKALDLVVGHECLHVARGDGWLRPLERVVADVVWFNPFAWIMRREADMARELACDEGVVAISDARRAYARALRDVAGLAVSLPASLPAASMSLAGSGRSLAVRVRRTLALAKRKPARAAILATVVLGAAGACTSVGQAMMATPAKFTPVQTVAAKPSPIVHQSQSVEAQVVTSTPGAAPQSPRPNLTPIKMQQEPPAPRAVQAARPTAELEARLAAAKAALASIKPRYDAGLIDQEVMADREAALAMAKAALDDAKAGSEPGKGIASAEAQLRIAAARAKAVKQRFDAGLIDPEVMSDRDAALAMARAAVAEAKAGGEPGKGIASAEAQLRIATVRLQEGKRRFDAGLIDRDELAQRDAALAIARARLADLQGRVAPAPKANAPTLPGRQPMDYSPSASPRPGATPIVMQQPPTAPKGGGVKLEQIDWASAAVVDAPARLESGYGERIDASTQRAAWHDGTDIAAAMGVDIHSPGDGVVSSAGPLRGYGNAVEVTYPGGVLMRFGHLKDVKVAAGAVVKAGDVLGTMGSTGRTAGTHLHLEVFYKGRSQDPTLVRGLTLIGGS